jgi:hypothetical protein
MKCPHCLESFHDAGTDTPIGEGDKDYTKFKAVHQVCPACKRMIVYLRGFSRNSTHLSRMVYPKQTARAPLTSDVPASFATDYSEACAVINESPKASAALSRRCLQNILRDKAKVKHQDLSKEIDEILSRKELPSYLAESVDAVRNIGNFAAHPIKSTNTGEIVDVEPGEAEWLLDVLEGLFDFYFVQPAVLKAKRAALDKKLQEAGKPPMK